VAISAFAPSTTTYTFRQMVFSDIQRIRPRKRPSWLGILVALPAHPGVLASLFLRTQQVLVRRGWVKAAWWTRTLCNVVLAADIAPGADVGLGIYFVHPSGVCLGYGARVGDNATFASGVVLGVRDLSDGDGYGTTATVGDNVSFGSHAVVLGGVTIGDNAMIGANTVVVADVPEDAVMLGVPARRVGTQPRPADA
jgi:serine O-acetyltransferase